MKKAAVFSVLILILLAAASCTSTPEEPLISPQTARSAQEAKKASAMQAGPAGTTEEAGAEPAQSEIAGVAEKREGPPLPPKQPEKGPGGAEYKHKKVIENTYGTGGRQYWLFEPDDPKPEEAPVVVFNHGWGGMKPSFYRGWVEHIVKRGNIVIFPRYQRSLLTPPGEFTSNAVAAVNAALAELKKDKHVKPDTDRVAVVGHSMGGAISANLAAIAKKENLPKFKAVMCVEPGMGPFNILADCSKIPADTLLLCVAGEDDTLVGERTAKKIFSGAKKVEKENKNLITVCTDYHGEPALVADHFAPVDRRVDALAWYGFWKWFDALSDAAFHGKNRKYALGNTPEQRFMGKWSDGKPVKKAKITDSP